MWAHAEYIKVLPSTHDGQVFDRIPAVAERYQGRRRQQPIEVWAFNRHVRSVPPGTTPRAQAAALFRRALAVHPHLDAVRQNLRSALAEVVRYN